MPAWKSPTSNETRRPLQAPGSGSGRLFETVAEKGGIMNRCTTWPGMTPSQDQLAQAQDGGENRQIVGALLMRLPSECRQVLVLREYEKLSYEDIARVLGSDRETVAARLSEARRQLLRLLEDSRMGQAMVQN